MKFTIEQAKTLIKNSIPYTAINLYNKEFKGTDFINDVVNNMKRKNYIIDENSKDENKQKKKQEKFRIYIASALFTTAEREWNSQLSKALKKEKFEVILPQDECEGMTDSYEIFSRCSDWVEMSDLVLANMEGTDVDSGTAFECGLAFGKNIPVIGIRTDFRQRGDDKGLNCMLSISAYAIITQPTIPLIITDFKKILSEVEYYDGRISYSKIPKHIRG